jgi:hypothetical protein
MKRIILSLVCCSAMLFSFAQSDRYAGGMQKSLGLFDSAKTIADFQAASASFSRIGDAEKTQWLPYYYAALGHAMTGLMQNAGAMGAGGDKVDPLANKAEELLNKAEALSKDNSEIYCVKKMIATLRLTADPMNRYMTYGPMAAEALAKAKSLNPENPRVYLLDGQDKFYTPEEFGGSKTGAKALFELSAKKFESFKPESDIAPSWGLPQVKYFLSQIK